MKIAYTSDLHINHYFGRPNAPLNAKIVEEHFGNYFRDAKSDILLVAGDDGDHPLQNIEFYNYLKELYGFKHIITVLGNHNAWLSDKYDPVQFIDGIEKLRYTTDLYNSNGITCLEGTTIEIDGITIGGTHSWYDGKIYTDQMSPYGSPLMTFWKRIMNDSHYMKLDDFYGLCKEEMENLKKLHGKCDVMMTHVCPSVYPKAFVPRYRNDTTNAFYSFDYEEQIHSDPRLKYWAYGHTHDVHQFTTGNCKILTNPKGYPSEQNLSRELRYIKI